MRTAPFAATLAVCQPSGTGTDMTMVIERVSAGRSDRLFFTGMGVVLASVVFAGFAPTFYLRGSALPPLSPMLFAHGLVFTTWILLFVTQTTLIAAERRDIHRRLGVIGMFIAGLVVVIGMTVAVGALRRGVGPVFGMQPGSFFSFPVEDISAFAALVVAGIVLRHHPDAHKRLMLLATISLLPAAIARVVFPFGAGIVSWFILTDLFVFAAVLYDRGRQQLYLSAGALRVQFHLRAALLPRS